MTTAVPHNILSIAIDHAEHGRRVALCCPPDQDGNCHCGGAWDDKLKQLVPHKPKEVGKAPIGRLFPKGINGATTNTATLDRMLREIPDANLSVDLTSTDWLVVDTDSAETEAAELAHGLDGAVIRESRHRAYVFERPADCPPINLIKKDGDALDILTTGNFLVHGTHQSGAPIRMDPDAKPGPAPARYVDMLKAKAAQNAALEAATAARREERARQYGGGPEPPVRLHQRGMRRWTGELVEKKDGKLDRGLSLWYVGLDLAECGASEGAIIAALEERDASLGWEKFTRRKDDREYIKIAEKVVASAIEKERAPQLKVTAPASVPDDVVSLRAALEAAEARITYLERALMDRDDRLEVLEPIVNQIDAIIQRPDEELNSDDKIVDIGLIRWLPYHQAKREARGESPAMVLGYLSKVIGMPKKRISKSLERQSSNDPNDGAPFRRRVTRTYHENEQRWESSLEIQAWGETPVATLRAAATFTPTPRPKRGGSKEASDARRGRCDKHDNREVRIKGYCPECGKVVGERIVRLAEFEALNVQLGHSEEGPPMCRLTLWSAKTAIQSTPTVPRTARTYKL
jgi:hypothetical protein